MVGFLGGWLVGEKDSILRVLLSSLIELNWNLWIPLDLTFRKTLTNKIVAAVQWLLATISFVILPLKVLSAGVRSHLYLITW